MNADLLIQFFHDKVLYESIIRECKQECREFHINLRKWIHDKNIHNIKFEITKIRGSLLCINVNNIFDSYIALLDAVLAKNSNLLSIYTNDLKFILHINIIAYIEEFY